MVDRSTCNLALSARRPGLAEQGVPGAEEAGAECALPPIGLILNPRSHRNKSLRNKDFGADGVYTAAPSTKEELEATLRRFADQGVGILAIGGGDGTVRDVLSRAAEIFETWPEIVILPLGKTNALAIDMGLPHDWSLEQAIESARAGRTILKRPVVVEPRDRDARTKYGFLMGAGVFKAAIDAGQVAHRFGAFQSVAVAVTTLFSLLWALMGVGQGPWRRRYGMHLTDLQTGSLPLGQYGQPGQYYLAGFSTLEHFPLGMKPFPQCAGQDGLSYLLVDSPLRRAIAMLPLAFFGRESALMRRLGIHRGTGSQFDVRLEDGFVLDGEMYPAGRYRVSAGPALRFIVP